MPVEVQIILAVTIVAVNCLNGEKYIKKAR